MSRQKGKRDRPAPERRARREKYSRKSKQQRAKPRLSERPQWTDPIPAGRRWTAVLAGTVVAVTAFGLVAAALVEAGDGRETTAIWLAIGAAASVPLMLAVIGFVSRAAAPWRTVALGSPVVVALFLVVSFIAREPVTGFVAAAGVGAALSMRVDEGVHSRSWRMWIAVGLTLYVKVLYLFSVEVAIIGAPLLPVAAIGVIDRILERRRQVAAER